jgi:hypothetical protein
MVLYDINGDVIDEKIEKCEDKKKKTTEDCKWQQIYDFFASINYVLGILVFILYILLNTTTVTSYVLAPAGLYDDVNGLSTKGILLCGVFVSMFVIFAERILR